MRTRGIPPLAKPEISRFPRKERPHMPGSWTTPGRAAARAIASVRVAFRAFEHVGTQVAQVFAAQWLAYVLPYRRFADTLASANARLGADADRYSFTVVDLHHLLFAGLYRRTITQDFRAFCLSQPHQRVTVCIRYDRNYPELSRNLGDDD
jgi:hypothetical protein